MHVRIGVSALLEGLEGSDTLKGLVPELARLSQHASHQVRSDACHLLGLTHSPDALEALRSRLEDGHPEVREIAGESIEALTEEK
jgi:HEAT repeat protein